MKQSKESSSCLETNYSVNSTSVFHSEKWPILFLSNVFFVVFCFCFFFFFCFLGQHLRHMEVPGLGVESDLELLASATATAKPDLNCVCSLHHGSWQRWICGLLSGARDRTCISWMLVRFINHWAMMGTPFLSNLDVHISPNRGHQYLGMTAIFIC